MSGTKSTHTRIFRTLILVVFCVASLATASQVPIPVTGQGVEAGADFQRTETANAPLPDFDKFVAAVENGQADQVRGVYVPGVLALRVIQQPDNDSGYVSSIAGVATQFQDAADSGTIGLIAHNYLAGNLFFDLKTGQEVRVVYGDGRVERFFINAFYRYQATEPDSPYSDFIDLENEERLSSGQLFRLVYRGSNQVTFQTCIAKDDTLTWGRLFVVASPTMQTNNEVATYRAARMALLLGQYADEVSSQNPEDM